MANYDAAIQEIEVQEIDIVETLESAHSIEVTVSSDYYHAFLTVEIIGDTPIVMSEDILEELAKKSISYGIDYSAVESIIQNPELAKNILVAMGIPLKNGLDGVISFKYSDSKKAKPKVLEDGSVDYKNMDTFQFVNEGDLLAEKTLPTEGEDGMSVTGRVIKAKNGKTIQFKKGKNTIVSEDGLQLLAEKSGIVQFTGDQIDIIEVLMIQGDVGVETGNINFTGKVIVSGNVMSGYEIISDEDIEINGIVECATLKSKGDITIRQGVQGKDKAYIECKGNLKTGFLNNCHVKVSGNIDVDSIMHCQIDCDDSVFVHGKKGIIVGGALNVKKLLEAKIIGSEMGTITSLRLGVDSEIMEDYRNVVKRIKENKSTIKKLDQAVALLYKQMDRNIWNDKLQAMLDKSLKSKNQYDLDSIELHKQFVAVNKRIECLRDAIVKSELIHPGVKVRIGHSYYKIMQSLMDVKIMKVEDKIITTSLK